MSLRLHIACYCVQAPRALHVAIYPPGTHASTDEVIALAATYAEHGGVSWHEHMDILQFGAFLSFPKAGETRFPLRVDPEHGPSRNGPRGSRPELTNDTWIGLSRTGGSGRVGWPGERRARRCEREMSRLPRRALERTANHRA